MQISVYQKLIIDKIINTYSYQTKFTLLNIRLQFTIFIYADKPDKSPISYIIIIVN